MKVTQYSFVCSNGHSFLAPLILTYGEFVMRDARGTPKYLDAVNNAVFDEFSKLVRSAAHILRIPLSEGSAIEQDIFGLACDRGYMGSEFKIGILPQCPHCKTPQMRSWELPTPPATAEIEEITHHAWNKLSTAEKCAKIKERLDARSANPTGDQSKGSPIKGVG
jgi:hypothetical protein